MTVIINVGRFDLIRFHITTLFKVRGNWVFFLMIWGFSFLTAYSGGGLGPNYNSPLITLTFTFFVSIIAFAIFFGVMMIFILISAGRKAGWIGEHTYTLEDVGLRERTEVGDSLHYWSGIHDIISVPSMTMIKLNQFSFVLVPKNGFEDSSLYEPFCADAMLRWKGAS